MPILSNNTTGKSKPPRRGLLRFPSFTKLQPRTYKKLDEKAVAVVDVNLLTTKTITTSTIPVKNKNNLRTDRNGRNNYSGALFFKEKKQPDLVEKYDEEEKREEYDETRSDYDAPCDRNNDYEPCRDDELYINPSTDPNRFIPRSMVQEADQPLHTQDFDNILVTIHNEGKNVPITTQPIVVVNSSLSHHIDRNETDHFVHNQDRYGQAILSLMSAVDYVDDTDEIDSLDGIHYLDEIMGALDKQSILKDENNSTPVQVNVPITTAITTGTDTIPLWQQVVRRITTYDDDEDERKGVDEMDTVKEQISPLMEIRSLIDDDIMHIDKIIDQLNDEIEGSIETIDFMCGNYKPTYHVQQSTSFCQVKSKPVHWLPIVKTEMNPNAPIVWEKRTINEAK